MNEIQNKMSKIVLIVSSFFFLLCFVMGFFFAALYSVMSRIVLNINLYKILMCGTVRHN